MAGVACSPREVPGRSLGQTTGRSHQLEVFTGPRQRVWGAEYGWGPGGRGQSLLTGASGPLSGKAGPARPRLRGSGVKRGRREGPSSGPARGAQAGRRGLSASDPRASPEPAPSSPSSPLLGSLPLPTPGSSLWPHFTGEGPRGQRGRACCPRAPRLVCGGAGAPPSLHPQLWAARALVTLGRGCCPRPWLPRLCNGCERPARPPCQRRQGTAHRKHGGSPGERLATPRPLRGVAVVPPAALCKERGGNGVSDAFIHSFICSFGQRLWGRPWE